MKHLLSLLLVSIIVFACAFSCEKDDDVNPKCKHHHKLDKDSANVLPN